MRIVSFSYFLPYEGVPHAGGLYYLRHVRALEEAGHIVTLVAPATSANRTATPPPGIDVVLVEESKSMRARLLDVFTERLRASVLPVRFSLATKRDPRVAKLLQQADLIEYQWAPAAGLHRALATLIPAGVPAVCVAHDVVGQSLLRLARQPGIRLDRRVMRRIRAAVGRFDERRGLRAMDVVLTFSAKDRRLLGQYGLEAEVVDPPLAASAAAAGRREPAGSRLLFVGAFDRMENEDAADWLLREIWPRVRAARPDAGLDLVGAHPTPTMMRAAAADPSVRVSGYVEDLQPFYESAALAVVPLRLGAGVKFKVITAMLEGLPVVTTAVGAEGIAEDVASGFVAVEDDPERFADAVIAHLETPSRGLSSADAARSAARLRYGFAGFQARLDSMYADAADRSRAA